MTRYLIMDTMLDFSTMFLLGLVTTWMLHACYEVACTWWQEGKQEVEVEILDHEDPRLADIKEV